MCSYFKVIDHTIEEFPQLISKWKSKVTGNQNQLLNANQNVKKILVEPREPTIVVLIRGGVVIGEDTGEPWKNTRI